MGGTGWRLGGGTEGGGAGGGATLLWDGVGVVMGGRGRLRRWGVSEGWAVGDRLSAQRVIQVLKSRRLVAGWRRGTDQPPPSPDHLRDPSSFSAKKKIHSHPTHTGTLTSAPTPHPQLRNIHSCIQVLNCTSNVPHTYKCTHTQAPTDTHSYPLTTELWSSPILTSPVHTIHILKRATRTSLLLEPTRCTYTPAFTH